MTIKEINDYIYEYSLTKSTNIIILSWKIINFLSMMISGKMRDLIEYLPKKRLVVKSHKEKLIDKALEKAKQLGHIK